MKLNLIVTKNYKKNHKYDIPFKMYINKIFQVIEIQHFTEILNYLNYLSQVENNNYLKLVVRLDTGQLKKQD